MPAKRVKKIDWSRCIICQEKNKTKLRTATESSISKFIDAINIQQGECYELLKYDINNLRECPIVWHNICYAKYTSTKNLKYTRKRSHTPPTLGEEDKPAESSSIATRSSSSAIDWSLCMFCQKKSHKNVKKLSSVSTSTACQTIFNAAEEKDDVQIMINIRNVDFIAAKAKCHEACRATYISKHNLGRQSYNLSKNL